MSAMPSPLYKAAAAGGKDARKRPAVRNPGSLKLFLTSHAKAIVRKVTYMVYKADTTYDSSNAEYYYIVNSDVVNASDFAAPGAAPASRSWSLPIQCTLGWARSSW